MPQDLASIDWDEFDESNPLFSSISARLKAHSASGASHHKYWKLPGWIGSGDLTVIFGPSEAGKSVFSVDLSCRLAAGWDFDGGRDRPRNNVLYIAAERGDQVRRRIDAFVKHHGGEPFDNLLIYDGPIDLCEDRLLRAVVRTAGMTFDDGTVDVVVIDTLAAAMTASDSNPEAMHRAVASLTDAVRNGNPDCSCTVIVVHHTPVNGEARMRGAGQLQGAADMTIHVTRKRGISVAKVAKNNESSDRPVRSYRMETVSLGRFHVDDPETTAPVLIEAQQNATETDNSKPLRRHREAVAILADAVIANDSRPVTEEQWRTAVYQAAGDISEGGKRLKFSRHKEILEAGLAVEEAGHFRLL